MIRSILRGATWSSAIGALGLVLFVAVAIASPAITAPGRTARVGLALAAMPGELVNDLLGRPLSPTARVMVRPPHPGTGCELVGSRWWTWWLFGWALVPCGLLGGGLGSARAYRRRPALSLVE